MRKKANAIKLIIIVISLLIIIPSVYIAIEASNNKIQQQKKENEIIPQKQKGIAFSENNNNKPKRPVKKEVDISIIQLSDDAESVIKKSDEKNYSKYIKNYKKMIVEMDVPDEYRKEIIRLIKKGYSVPDLFSIYEYVNENYGKIQNLESMLDKKKSGENLAQIFEEYKNATTEYIPTDFEKGYLENLFKDTNITGDDVVIADRLSQKGYKKFDDLITLRKQGKKWSEINLSLGVLNMSEKAFHISVTKSQVNDYMKKTNLSEDKVLDGIIIAWKFDKDEDEIINKIKEGKKKEDILSQLYQEKYN